jgi:mannose-6-phosphate isomerase-like protein (cupin superfamily)
MIIDKSKAEHYNWGEGCDGWHLLKNENLSIIQERVPPGKQEKRHFHTKSRQFFYILRGKAAIEMDETIYQLQTGQSIEIPPGVPHQFMNQSSVEVEFLVISSPKSHGDRTDLE